MELEDPESQPILLFKYGGNAMSDDRLKKEVLKSIGALHAQGFNVVIVHGGGPFIKKALNEAKIESEFIDGQRKTTAEAFEYVEMTLKGKVNSNLVSLLNGLGHKAVGLSGQDGQIVIASKRHHETLIDGKMKAVDLGQVGDVAKVNPRLIHLLLKSNFIPVISCTAADEAGVGYNINGDMFAGHLAGALKADEYVVLTDVDGLMKDKDDPSTLINAIQLNELKMLVDDGTIQGGMIPKIESCEIALNKGTKSARIINGTKPGQLQKIAGDFTIGTNIKK
ncbi:MAG TPA: acetylglutamate kinase [Salinivirga sp.]|uniref:acetylglutamate kinase n=1 Tax=Salinivirga sp. TaxID=1970192 RepID=UPI002B4A75D3|nr:acetylglutamate kinase [Salinivirga sp.]HKK59281.1 acetylglutamate kinase [Salinivirga sp.]